MIFGMWNTEKIWHQSLYSCPLHLLAVVTLPWQVQKSHFQQYYYRYWLLVLYQNETNCNHNCELAHHIWKMSSHYLVKYIIFVLLIEGMFFLQMLVNNNNNLRLLQLQSNHAIIHYQHSPRRAGNNSHHAVQHYVQKG